MRRSIIALLRWLVPFRWVLLAIVALSATGFALHEMERFSGLQWGLTEIAHVWLGWAALGLWTGYLVHHLAVRWGSLRSPQRLLGAGASLASGVLLVTGVMLAVGMQGGPPGWTVPVHYWATWALLALVLAHTRVAWGSWPRRLWRRLVDGPVEP